MRQERTVQASIFDLFADHEIGRELKTMSQWLDEHREIIGLVAEDLRRNGVKETGRQGLPAESVLRCALLKQHRQLSYEELAFHLEDSASFRVFARLPQRIIRQTERRVLRGETVAANEKIVSLFGPHTDIIVKGSRQVEHGHKLNPTTGRSGLILDLLIEAGNPADSERFLPMLERGRIQASNLHELILRIWPRMRVAPAIRAFVGKDTVVPASEHRKPKYRTYSGSPTDRFPLRWLLYLHKDIVGDFAQAIDPEYQRHVDPDVFHKAFEGRRVVFCPRNPYEIHFEIGECSAEVYWDEDVITWSDEEFIDEKYKIVC